MIDMSQLDLFERTVTDEELWLEAHPEVEKEFRATADRLRAADKRYGAKAVAEIVRWQAFMSGRDDDDFKVNNNVVSLLARRYNESWPGYFDTRRSKFDE